MNYLVNNVFFSSHSETYDVNVEKGVIYTVVFNPQDLFTKSSDHDL